MKLNMSKGNMYDFITHTGNIIKGECAHKCSYCYMCRWGAQKPPRFDEKEIKGDTLEGNFIFIGSSTDMFANNIPSQWIIKALEYLSRYDNKYLFQSKNPMGMLDYLKYLPAKSVICTTLESNEFYPDIMKFAPTPESRAFGMKRISEMGYETFVTIEPILDFGHYSFIELIKDCNPSQVNIGADSGGNKLPEPSKDKVLELIDALTGFTIINQKNNLGRLLNVNN